MVVIVLQIGCYGCPKCKNFREQARHPSFEIGSMYDEKAYPLCEYAFFIMDAKNPIAVGCVSDYSEKAQLTPKRKVPFRLNPKLLLVL